MKIVLIEPKPPGKHVFSTVKMPRLGLPILGTILREKGHEVRLVYEVQREARFSDLNGCDLVGISATTSTAYSAYRLADLAREMGIMTVMGGPHVTFMPEEALNHCDYVLRREAENSFPLLLDRLAVGQEPIDVPGISYLKNGQIVSTPDPKWIDVGSIPYPDISLLAHTRLSTYPVMTSRGCPYDCTFCSVTAMFGHKFRCRPIGDVIEELRQYRGKQVFFVDDNFVANPKRAKELMRAMLREKIGLKCWFAQVRTDAARDDELLELMQKSGCRYVYVGMESVNPETLKQYNKKQEVADIEYCIERFHQHGILVHGMFVFGADEDTVETLRETVRFALDKGIDTVQFMILTPLPGTRTFEDLDRTGRIFSYDWNLYDAHHVVFQPARMTALELQREAIRAFKEFYSLPNILRSFWSGGAKTAAFRAVGHILVRRWEKENSWYYSCLRARHLDEDKTWMAKEPEKEVLPGLGLALERAGREITATLFGVFKERKIKKTIRYLSHLFLCEGERLAVDLRQAKLSCEKAWAEFMTELDKVPSAGKQVMLKIPLKKAEVFQIMKRYDLPLPSFIICTVD